MNVDKANKCLRCLGIGYQFREDKKIKTKQNKEVHRKRTLSDWNIPIVIINLILLASLCAYYFWGSQLDFLGYVFPLLGMYSFLTQRVVNNSKNLALSYVLYSLSTFAFLDKQFLSTVILFIIYLIVDKLPINILEGLSILVTKSWEFFQDIKPWLVANIITDMVVFSLINLLFQIEDLPLSDNFATFIVYFIILFPPAVRVWLGVKNYITYHKISKGNDKTFFMIYFLQYIFTFIGYFFVIYILLIGNRPNWLKCLTIVIFYLFMIFIVSIVKPVVDCGGDDKKDLSSSTVYLVVAFFIINLINEFARDFIELLVWFLPIVIYNILGDLKELRPNRIAKYQFNQLVHSISMYLFLILVIINFINIFSYDSYLLGERLVEINRPQQWVISLLTFNNEITIPEQYLFEVMYNLVVVCISIVLAVFFSYKIKQFFKKQFLYNRQYFEQKYLFKGAYRTYQFRRTPSLKTVVYKGVVKGIRLNK